MVGPDKPVIFGQWLFRVCEISSAGNMPPTPLRFVHMVMTRATMLWHRTTSATAILPIVHVVCMYMYMWFYTKNILLTLGVHAQHMHSEGYGTGSVRRSVCARCIYMYVHVGICTLVLLRYQRLQKHNKGSKNNVFKLENLVQSQITLHAPTHHSIAHCNNHIALPLLRTTSCDQTCQVTECRTCYVVCQQVASRVLHFSAFQSL